jgi:hypothetical protein
MHTVPAAMIEFTKIAIRYCQRDHVSSIQTA